MSFAVKLLNLLDFAKPAVAALGSLTASRFIIPATGTLIIWILLRGGNAIIGEYWKRFWFRRFHRDAVALKESCDENLAIEIKAALEELQDLRSDLKRLRSLPVFTVQRHMTGRKRRSKRQRG